MLYETDEQFRYQQQLLLADLYMDVLAKVNKKHAFMQEIYPNVVDLATKAVEKFNKYITSTEDDEDQFTEY